VQQLPSLFYDRFSLKSPEQTSDRDGEGWKSRCSMDPVSVRGPCRMTRPAATNRVCRRWQPQFNRWP
ncbi:MAG: hypothetical protein O2931_13050, partial [Planctomycetota bacterium]|nr:hypothetical protein [Planctomycetota bacterium]